MTVTCAGCSLPFEARSASAKYCSPRCRKRGSRARPVTALPSPLRVEGELTTATREALEAAGREASPAGRAALLLASRLDSATADTGSAIAALVREHRATLAEATRGLKVAGDPLDELKSRRDRKYGG